MFAEPWQAQAFALAVKLPERLVTEKGLIDRASRDARKEAWADAYRRTPHGKPVELG